MEVTKKTKKTKKEAALRVVPFGRDPRQNDANFNQKGGTPIGGGTPFVSHVSDTSLWIAHHRALETARKDALFQDPLAALLAQDRGREIAKKMNTSVATGWSVAIRTVTIDNFIEQAVQAGVDLVLNLGAGLDTRPYRMNLPATLQWVEIDFPHVIDYKENILSSEKPRCQLERIKLDLSNREARDKVLSEMNSRAQNILVITEGVTIYLTEEQVGELAESLAAQNHIHGWVNDYLSPTFMKLYRQGRMGKLLENNVPFQFDPADWTGFFQAKGWALKEMRYMTTEGRRLNRPFPLSPWVKLFSRFFSKERRETLRKISGYALLTR